MKQFEYYHATRSNNDLLGVDDLNRLGENGWELVTCNNISVYTGSQTINRNHFVYIFKREKV